MWKVGDENGFGASAQYIFWKTIKNKQRTVFIADYGSLVEGEHGWKKTNWINWWKEIRWN